MAFLQQTLSFEKDVALCNPAVRRKYAQQSRRESALAAPRLAEHPEDFSLRNADTHTLQRENLAARLSAIVDVKILHVQEQIHALRGLGVILAYLNMLKQKGRASKAGVDAGA